MKFIQYDIANRGYAQQMAARTATVEGTRRSRVDDGNKRQAIVDAARTLFTTKGYEATTMAEVASQADIAVGTVYLYFKNKNDLLYAVKGDWDDQFLQFLAQPELQAIPHHLRTRPLIEACFALCDRHTELIQLMGLQPEMVGNWHDKGTGKVAQVITAFFDEAVANGSFRPIDTQAAAVIAYGMVENALQQCYMVEQGSHRERYIDVLVDALENWLVNPKYLADRYLLNTGQ